MTSSTLIKHGLAELNAPQLDELAKLAKEMLCPYVKNNKCKPSSSDLQGLTTLPGRFGDDCVYG